MVAISLWDTYINGFKAYLQLERSMSFNTVSAYLHDVTLLRDFFLAKDELNFEDISLTHIQSFIEQFSDKELAAPSQSRIISGVRAFFNYLISEDIIKSNPTDLLDRPKPAYKLPDVLSAEEIEILFSGIDH